MPFTWALWSTETVWQDRCTRSACANSLCRDFTGKHTGTRAVINIKDLSYSINMQNRSYFLRHVFVLMSHLEYFWKHMQLTLIFFFLSPWHHLRYQNENLRCTFVVCSERALQKTHFTFSQVETALSDVSLQAHECLLSLTLPQWWLMYFLNQRDAHIPTNPLYCCCFH